MVLVDADRVEAALGGVFEFVHEVVVHVMRPPRVEQRGMDIDPYRRVLLAEIVGQFGVRHQVEPHQLHGSCSERRQIDPAANLTLERRRVNRAAPNGADGSARTGYHATYYATLAGP